jgi:hypothetical protein
MMMPMIVPITPAAVTVFGLMPMTVPARVAAGFGLERTFDDQRVKAELVHQAIEHVVVLIRQPTRLDLQRHVAIAEMVGGPR